MNNNVSDFGMQGLISIINDIQDVFSIVGGNPIDLPQIAVVGGQSSGKSSVLENIVGRDFLPRGSGIVTRCPLVLQLVRVKDLTTEYAVFAHKPNKQFYDFDEVRNEIVSQTERETGTGVAVTDKPINLKIYSPNVVNLTLIDLPGITRNPVGDQPKNIEEILRNMVVRYIREPSCIIMAVTAANTDLALSDAIQLAKQYDPSGERTIGVITKVDIMDKGTDAGDIFDGHVIPLKLGYVGVINRSQNDINTRKDMHLQWEDERRFFRTYYPDRCERMGTQYLRNRLNTLLVEHISRSLPDIISKVTLYRQQVSSQLAELKSVNDGLADVNATAVQLFITFSQQLKVVLFGRGTDTNQGEEELTGGARILDIFSHEFTSGIQALDARECLGVKEIRTAIVNNRGIHGGLFASEKALEMLIGRCLSQFETPCFVCIEKVKTEFQSAVSTIKMPEFQYFPRFRDAVIRETLNLLEEKSSIAKDMVHVLLEMEKAYINTGHEELSAAKIQKLQGSAIATARARFAQKLHPNDPKEFQEPMVQGWVWLRSSRGRFERMYAMVKQRSLLYNTSTSMERSDPGLKEVFLEGAQARAVHSNAAMGEFEFEVAVGEQVIGMKVESEAQEANWVAWVNVASSEEVWRDTLTKMFPVEKEEEGKKEAGEKKEEASVFQGSKVGVLRESGEWNEYNNNEQVMIEYMSRLIDTYLDTVKKNIMDSLPKCITLYLLNQTVDNVYNVLIANIYNKGMVQGLMAEDESLVKKREDLQRVLSLLDKALRNLTNVKMSKSTPTEIPQPGMKKDLSPWEKGSGGTFSEIDWSVVRSKGSLIDKK